MIPWILRVGVAGCFIGHGAFGVITKAAWLPYFAVGGIPEPLAWQLMPWVGTMDIVIGLLALAWPCRALLAWAVVWTVWTALCRPLSGESGWEFLERAGNYGVPLALLTLAGARGAWFARLNRWPSLTAAPAQLAWTLRLTTALLLIGHAGCGACVQKPLLGQLYTAIWPHAPAEFTVWVGLFEFALAAAVLFRPVRPLLLGVCAWKLASETLFLAAGFPVWEVIERFGSYTAPLALALLPLPERAARVPAPSSATA